MSGWLSLLKTAGTWVCFLCIFLLPFLYIFALGKMALRSGKASCWWDFRTGIQGVESADESLHFTPNEAFGIIALINNIYCSSCRLSTKLRRICINIQCQRQNLVKHPLVFNKNLSRKCGDWINNLTELTERIHCRDRNGIQLRNPKLVC